MLKDWKNVGVPIDTDNPNRSRKYIKWIKGKKIGQFTSDEEVVIVFKSNIVYLISKGRDLGIYKAKSKADAIRYAKAYMEKH